MNTSKLLPISALVLALVGTGAVVATAQNLTVDPAAQGTAAQVTPADFSGGRDGDGRDGDGRDGDGRDGGEHGPRGKGGMGFGGGRGGEMFASLIAKIDADGNGAITQAELDAYRTAQVTAADASKDGALSVDEFETLYRDFVRPQMVDTFQGLDEDGDGVVTKAELDARFGAIVERMDQNNDGALSQDDAGRGHRG